MFKQIIQHLNRFLYLPDPHYAPVLAAWAAHTHVYRYQRSTPRLIVTAYTKDAGKTTTMRVMRPLCSGPTNKKGIRGAVTASKVSSAVIAHRINRADEDGTPITLMLDEFDQIFKGPESGMLTGVINNGYTPFGTVSKMFGGEEKEYATYAPIMLAGIKSGVLDDTTLSRSIELVLRTARPEEVARLEEYMEIDHDHEGDEMAERIRRWLHPHHEDLQRAKPSMPAGVINRNKEVWGPLIAIADLAGKEWGRVLREACIAFCDVPEFEGRNPGEELLAKVLRVFEDMGNPARLANTVIVELLQNEGWPDMSSRNLVASLEALGVPKAQVRHEGSNTKGFRLDDLERARGLLRLG